MKENTHGLLMPSIEEVVASSMSINSRLPAQLEKALERNIVLRIGWTTNGDPVPKDGEMGYAQIFLKVRKSEVLEIWDHSRRHSDEVGHLLIKEM